MTINPADPPPDVGLTVSEVTAESGAAYTVVEGGLENGAVCYIDRDYVYGSIPDFLVGATYIMTANDDKNSQGSDFLSFMVTGWMLGGCLTGIRSMASLFL